MDDVWTERLAWGPAAVIAVAVALGRLRRWIVSLRPAKLAGPPPETPPATTPERETQLAVQRAMAEAMAGHKKKVTVTETGAAVGDLVDDGGGDVVVSDDRPLPAEIGRAVDPSYTFGELRQAVPTTEEEIALANDVRETVAALVRDKFVGPHTARLADEAAGRHVPVSQVVDEFVADAAEAAASTAVRLRRDKTAAAVFGLAVGDPQRR